MQQLHDLCYCSNAIFRINLVPKGEYLLLENRQKVGFDTGICSAGLAIYHVDESVPRNDNPGHPGLACWPRCHYRVALLQADGQFHLEQKGKGSGSAGVLRGPWVLYCIVLYWQGQG
jgi:hypothetical protein